jgi:hypothetical protein
MSSDKGAEYLTNAGGERHRQRAQNVMQAVAQVGSPLLLAEA